jgi:hypothetical protein
MKGNFFISFFACAGAMRETNYSLRNAMQFSSIPHFDGGAFLCCVRNLKISSHFHRNERREKMSEWNGIMHYAKGAKYVCKDILMDRWVSLAAAASRVSDRNSFLMLTNKDGCLHYFH